MEHNYKTSSGFTLIELSIVLVIIGLIVGGVLVGRDLIAAAEVRAQISQIEKYHTAVNTFRGKFGGLPGDLDDASASRFGLPILSSTPFFLTLANGILEGEGNSSSVDHDYTAQDFGENALFWEQLASAAGGRLVEDRYMPVSKISDTAYVYTYSQGAANWFGLAGYSAGYSYASDYRIIAPAEPRLTVAQAYNIDKKVDDGLPAAGRAIAATAEAPSDWQAGPTHQTSATLTGCYTSGAYSITTNNGMNVNCALSFKFQ